MQCLQKHPRRHDILKQQPKHRLCSTSQWLISWQLQTWLTLTAVTQASGLQQNLIPPPQVCVRPHVSPAGVATCLCCMLGRLDGHATMSVRSCRALATNLISECHAEKTSPMMRRMQQAVTRTQKHHIVTIQAVSLKLQGTAHCYLKCLWSPFRVAL